MTVLSESSSNQNEIGILIAKGKTISDNNAKTAALSRQPFLHYVKK